MYSEMKPERLRAVGIPIEGSPEVLPSRIGHVLYGLITNGDSKQFVIAVQDAYTYGTYRNTTHHPGDQGNWFFRNMKLFFVPEDLAASGA
jgi:hypothetical protein